MAAIWAAMAFAALGDRERAWELLAMINPVNHALSAGGVATYKVEPYVVAADVYAVAPHTGRGGWTWYTGSAGWMYRLIVESLLGLRLEGTRCASRPACPADWQASGSTTAIGRPCTTSPSRRRAPAMTERLPTRVTVDGVERYDRAIPLVDDHREHVVDVSI